MARMSVADAAAGHPWSQEMLEFITHGKGQITTLHGLLSAVHAKRAVICPSHRVWSRARPAAFTIHLPGIMLLRIFDAGLYLYPLHTKENTP